MPTIVFVMMINVLLLEIVFVVVFTPIMCCNVQAHFNDGNVILSMFLARCFPNLRR